MVKTAAMAATIMPPDFAASNAAANSTAEVCRSGPPDRRTSAVELAAAFDAAKSGGMIVAAIAAVFTIGYVANMLSEDEDWLHELSIDMFPEDGCLFVYGVGEHGVTAFT